MDLKIDNSKDQKPFPLEPFSKCDDLEFILNISPLK